MKTTQVRLSTGKKVNSALDNPTSFFASVANQQKASDLSSLKDGIEQATQVIKAADAGMTAMSNVLRQASAIAQTAITSSSRGQLSQILDQFNVMRGQVDQLSADSGYGGTDLLRRQDLSVDLGDGSSLTLKGADATSSGFDNMTNGLGVEAPGIDIFNIDDSHTVLTSAGAIKQDGALTVTNNDTQSIDGWLGKTALNVQTIKSVDLAVSASMSGGQAVSSQILDNAGVAAYGSASFTMYRDTSVEVTGVSGSVSATAQTNNLADVSGYLGPLAGSGSAPITITKTPSVDSVGVTRGASRTLGATMNDPQAVSQFLDTQSVNPTLTFTYSAASHSWSTTDPAQIHLIQSGAPPGSLGMSFDGSQTSALDIALPGSWNDNDQIQINLDKWTTSDPGQVKVIGYGGNGLSVSVNSSQRNDIGVTLSAPESGVAFNTSVDLSANVSDWKSSDPSVSVGQSGGGLTADLNGDGSADLQFQLPGSSWLSTDTVSASTTGAFTSTDSSVRLKYDASSGNLGLFLGSGGGAPAMTVNLSGSWAASQLSSSPLGNGDTIQLTVDGRHRWLLSDNKTPNEGGIRLSMSETSDAIDTLRLNSAQNSSLDSVLTVRNDFIDSMVNILSVGADNLTLADMNEEGANMLMLQTRQNLATQGLSVFANASRNVLKMFSS